MQKRAKLSCLQKNLEIPLSVSLLWHLILIRVLCTSLPADIIYHQASCYIDSSNSSSSISLQMVVIIVFSFAWKKCVFLWGSVSLYHLIWRWVNPIKWFFLFLKTHIFFEGSLHPPLRYASGWKRWTFSPNFFLIFHFNLGMCILLRYGSGLKEPLLPNFYPPSAIFFYVLLSTLWIQDQYFKKFDTYTW